MKFNTSRFGELEVAEGKIIRFPDGLVGLPNLNCYALIDHRDTPVKWLQSVDDPDVAFIVTSPDLITPEYSLDLEKTIKDFIGLDSDDDMAVLVTMRVEGEDVIANFQGPLVINSRNMTGVQVVLDEEGSVMQEVI